MMPKALTHTLDALLNSPRGREILASAIVAAASAAAAALVKNPDSPQVANAREAMADTATQVTSATNDLSDAAASALAAVVGSVLRSFLPPETVITPSERSILAGQAQSERS
jgi:hypothetical protein